MSRLVGALFWCGISKASSPVSSPSSKEAMDLIAHCSGAEPFSGCYPQRRDRARLEDGSAVEEAFTVAVFGDADIGARSRSDEARTELKLHNKE